MLFDVGTKLGLSCSGSLVSWCMSMTWAVDRSWCSRLSSRLRWSRSGNDHRKKTAMAAYTRSLIAVSVRPSTSTELSTPFSKTRRARRAPARPASPPSTTTITTREATRAIRIWRWPCAAEVCTSWTSRIRSPHMSQQPALREPRLDPAVQRLDRLPDRRRLERLVQFLGPRPQPRAQPADTVTQPSLLALQDDAPTRHFLVGPTAEVTGQRCQEARSSDRAAVQLEARIARSPTQRPNAATIADASAP